MDNIRILDIAHEHIVEKYPIAEYKKAKADAKGKYVRCGHAIYDVTDAPAYIYKGLAAIV